MKMRLRSVGLVNRERESRATPWLQNNPVASEAIRVALPRYGPGFLSTGFISSERIEK